MPNYMLLLYTTEADATDEAARDAEWPEWAELIKSLEDDGLLLGHGRLQGVESATSVRIRTGDTEISDGPFAVTKEMLVGFFMLACRDLDHALEQAERVPLARYGTVEVRPVMA
jgi:hypothetical protein